MVQPFSENFQNLGNDSGGSLEGRTKMATLIQQKVFEKIVPSSMEVVAGGVRRTSEWRGWQPSSSQ